MLNSRWQSIPGRISSPTATRKTADVQREQTTDDLGLFGVADERDRKTGHEPAPGCDRTKPDDQVETEMNDKLRWFSEPPVPVKYSTHDWQGQTVVRRNHLRALRALRCPNPSPTPLPLRNRKSARMKVSQKGAPPCAVIRGSGTDTCYCRTRGEPPTRCAGVRTPQEEALLGFAQ